MANPTNQSSGNRICQSDDNDTPPCSSGCPCDDPGSSAEPIQYSSGAILLTEVDVSANIPGFQHARVWRNLINNDGNYNGPNGFNWDIQEWPYLVRRTLGTKVTINVRIGSVQLRFDKVGNDYVARHTQKDRCFLTHDSNTHLFTLTQRTGRGVDTIQFQDFDQSTNPAGLLWRRIDENGNEIEVISYTANGNINGVVTQRGNIVFQLSYTYFTSGTHQNRFQYVTLNKLDQYPNPTVTTPIRRAGYTYYDGSNNLGNANDLEAAIIQKPTGDPSPDDWEDIQVHYYRYYQSQTSHDLKYVVGPAAYAEIIQAGQDPLAGPPSGTDKVPDFADNYFEYDTIHRVTKEIARGCATCGSSGGTSDLGETFTRISNPLYPSAAQASADYLYNTWRTKTTSKNNDGHETLIYTNRVNRVMLKVIRELNTGGPVRQWCTYYEYDSQGREIMRAEPSAVTGFDESKPDLVGKQSNGTYINLKNNDGLIRLTTYYSSTTASDTTPGGVEGYVEFTKIKKGIQGTEIKTSRTAYLASDNSSGQKAYVVGTRTVYPDDTNQDATAITTSFVHTWYAPSGNLPVRMKERVTTLPVGRRARTGRGRRRR